MNKYRAEITLEPTHIFTNSSETKGGWDITICGVTFNFEGNEGFCLLEHNSISEAEQLVRTAMARFTDLLSVQIPFIITASIKDFRNLDWREPRTIQATLKATFAISVPDIANEPIGIQKRLNDWSQDEDILVSIEYFNLGKYLMSTDLKGHYGIAYLQFYKSVEMLLGTSKDISNLKKNGIPIGLTEQFLEQEITPLYDKRDDWDVAHRRRKGSNRVNEEDARKAQEIATKVIIQYLLSKYT